MGNEIAKLVVQSSSAAYSPVKDMFSYFNDKAKYVTDLEDNLTKLVEEMITFYSKKEQIDRILATSVSKEKSGEYSLSVTEIQVFERKYSEFIEKYHKHCKNLPNVIPELASTESKAIGQKEIATKETDALISHSVIEALQSRKPTILTRKFFKLAQLSKDINKLQGHISRATGRMKPENAMLEKEVQPVQVKRDDIDVPSFSVHVNKILRYLREDENKLIGIMGPIGVGKTTVMKMLNNQLKETSSVSSNGDISLKFDVVIWMDYSKQLDAEDKNIEMMQSVIMERLKLNNEKAKSIEQNADIISTALSNKKYIMLIDQVSFTFDLNEVGIYSNHRFGKVVFASSSYKVIRQMADQEVEIRPLSNNDALDLFQKVCGKIYDTRIKDLADKIIESCGGLPLVIKLVATFLKGVKEEDVWRRVKQVLQSETKSAKLLKLGGVGNAYKLVYDKLDENHMKCLLFVALFPSDQKINKNYLVECWKAEMFLELDTPELRSARECGATVLKELSDQYLLEPCPNNYVKMPLYFRKVALEQQYPGEGNTVVWVSEKNKLLSADTWKTTRRMSLICSKSKLPECPESGLISTLLLQWNPELVALGDKFFLKMQNLRILDLNQTGIESLPSSISSLINLMNLYLNDCSQLAELPPKVNLLKKLEVLDIRGTSIQILPDEIGEMLQLKCLRIRISQKGCNRKSKGKAVEMTIPLNIIRRLQQLEELTIETGCCFQGWHAIADQIACELSDLENLSSLNFHFPRVCSLEKFIIDGKSWRNPATHRTGNNFRSFKISIGCCETRHPYGSDISGILAERLLRFSTNSAEKEEISSVKEVLTQASAFELVGHSHLQSLSELALENTGSLKVCIVERCTSLTTLVDAVKHTEMGESAGALLQCLEKLHLFDLQFLRYIWKGSVFPGSLSNLKVLTLCGCPELTEILNHELANALPCLKRIKVKDCSKIVEIIKVQIQDGVDLSDVLHRVKTIELVNLPELRSICSTSSIQWMSLRRIMAVSCCKLRNLSLTLTNAEKLETIKCEDSWWSEVQLTKEEKHYFHPRCDFIVLEQSSALRTFNEGEASGSHGRSVIPHAPYNAGSQTHIGEIEETLSHNGFVSSYIDAKAETGADNPMEKIRRKAKFGSSSHQTSMVQAKVK